MPAKWIMYIPRAIDLAKTKDSAGPSLYTQAETWRTTVESKRKDNDPKYDFYLRCLGETFPGVGGPEDVVYVFGGHGVARRDGVGWPGNDSNLIDGAETAKRFAAEGWTPAFAGRVKVYSCYSGDEGKLAFASKFGVALRGTYKYDACTIFGYHNMVTQKYETLDPAKLLHRLKFTEASLPTGITTHRWSVGTGAKYVARAKAARDPF